MSQSATLSERLERIGRKLMATTEFSQDAHAVMEAAITLRSERQRIGSSESKQQDNAALPGVADVERILGGSTPPYTISDNTAAPAEARSNEADQRDATLEEAARLFDGYTYGVYAHPAKIIRALKRQSDIVERK